MRLDRGARTDRRQRSAIQSIRPALVCTSVVTGDYTAGYGELVVCDPSSFAFTVTLRPAQDHADEMVAVKNAASSGNNVTVDGGSSLIDGSATATVSDRECLWFQSDGEEWLIV